MTITTLMIITSLLGSWFIMANDLDDRYFLAAFILPVLVGVVFLGKSDETFHKVIENIAINKMKEVFGSVEVVVDSLEYKISDYSKVNVNVEIGDESYTVRIVNEQVESILHNTAYVYKQ